MGRRSGPGNSKWELYDLSKDVYEETNLAATRPEQLAELISLWKKMDGAMSDPLF